MKKISLLLMVILTSTASVFAQTADEVINKFIEASGGKDKLGTINTLQYDQLLKVKSPFGDMDITMSFYKEHNKFFRMQSAIPLGGQVMEFYTLVNDTAGYTFLPANPMIGSTGGVKKMDPKSFASQAFQLDAAGYFSNLVDYVAKGHKAELLKDDKVNSQEASKLKLTLKTGQEIVYYFSKANNLVSKIDLKGDMAANMSGMGGLMGGMNNGASMNKTEVSTLFMNYQTVDGLQFPAKIVVKSPMGDVDGTVSNIKINQAIDAKLYSAQ